MNQIEAILQKLAELTKWMNSITSNSKKISELPQQSEVLSSGKIAVDIAGEAKSLGLDKIIGLQNNIGRTISLRYTTEDITVALIVNKMNARTTIISEKETPVFISISDQPILTEDNGFQSFQSSKKYTFLFKPGKGTYGLGLNSTIVTASMITMVSLLNLTTDDVAIDPNSSIQPLGEVPDGNFVAAANEQIWELTNPDINYYFSFERDGVLYIAYFKGELGNYGAGQTLFTEDDFIITTNSNIVPQILRTDQLENTGEDGSSPFATVAQVNGLKIVVNQSSAEMYLRDASGATLATVNLAFLNNEGTTFFYDAASGNLQLKNDAGEVLSDVPVSAFVTNLIQYADFNASIPQRLEFKGPSGDVIDYVTLTINNVEGLQTALNNKANKDGSNATGINWAISILGNAATATQATNTTNWGGKPADFTYEGSDQDTVLGLDTSGIGRRFTKSSFKQWLAIAMADVSGLLTSLANITSALGNKAEKNGTNAYGTWANIVAGNTIALGGYPYTDGFVNYANVGNFLVRRANNADWVLAEPFVVAQALGITAKANDLDVIHTSGSETRTGNLTNLGIVRVGTGTVNFGQTRIRVVNDAGKVWALVSGAFGQNENYFTLVNETDNTTAFRVIPSGQVFFDLPVSVPNATDITHAVNLGQINGLVRPYKVYTALIQQSGTNPPDTIVLENTIGTWLNWSYASAGSYRLNTNGNEFVSGKTAVFINGQYSALSTSYLAYRWSRPDANTIIIRTSNGNSSVDGLLSDGSVIEVRVYN